MLKSLWLGSFLIFCTLLQAQEEIDLSESFNRLQKVKGAWFQANDQGDILEEWVVENDSTLSGRNFRVRSFDGDTTGSKTAEIRLLPTGIVYTTRIRTLNNNQPIDYPLVKVEDFAGQNTFTFENTKYEYPRRIIYVLEDNRNLVIKQEGERNGRPRVEEAVYEREFSAAAREMYVRAGLGAFQMHTNGTFYTNPDYVTPSFKTRPAWELAAQMVFKGRGGFIRFGLEVGLSGRYSFLDSASFSRDTVSYSRANVKYNQSWLHVALTPELRIDKKEAVTVFVGPYASRLLLVRADGDILPDPSGKTIYNANADLNKFDFGLTGGLNFKFNPWSKPTNGKLSLRGWLGLSNLDNLYTVGCTQCTGKISQRGVSLSYMLNIMGE